MRILVVGSLPPPEVSRARALRTEVTRLLAEGHELEVVGTDRVSTAHHYLSARGILGSLQLARLVGGFDSVIVQLEPGLPVRARAGRLERELSLTMFAFALGRARDVVLRLEHLEDLPGGFAGAAALKVWRIAGQIVLGSEDRRSSFVSLAGDAGEIAVVSAPSPESVGDDSDGWGEGADASAENVLELVRARSARERRERESAMVTHVVGWDRLALQGTETTERDSPPLRPPDELRGPGAMARRALAAADRRPLLHPLAAAARAARGQVRALWRADWSD